VKRRAKIGWRKEGGGKPFGGGSPGGASVLCLDRVNVEGDFPASRNRKSSSAGKNTVAVKTEDERTGVGGKEDDVG